MDQTPNRKYLAGGILLVFLMVLFAAVTSFSQEDVETVEDSGYESLMRPVVPFLHDEHNEAAEIEECYICHHVWTDDGELDEYGDSVGMECSECHMEEGGGKLELTYRYHRQCGGCHEEKGKGPVMCAECHPRK
jgi:Zn-finger nucleic acid-binding protein